MYDLRLFFIYKSDKNAKVCKISFKLLIYCNGSQNGYVLRNYFLDRNEKSHL